MSESFKRNQGFHAKLAETCAEHALQLARTEKALGKLEELEKEHSVSSEDPCQVKSLQPGSCPPGRTRLEQIKANAETSSSACISHTSRARQILEGYKKEALQVVPKSFSDERLAQSKKLLAEVKQSSDRVAQVVKKEALKSQDDVLESAGFADLPQGRKEKYEEVKAQWKGEHLEKLEKVAKALQQQNPLPMKLKEISGVAEMQKDLSGHIQRSEAALFEGEKILDNLKLHLDARLHACFCFGTCRESFCPIK